MTDDISQIAKEVIRRNTIEVQGGGNWELFDELFDENFRDHTPQPGGKPDKAGVLELYRRLREAFPDFTPEIHWQKADGDVVTTYKTYHGTHLGNFRGLPPTGKSFECQMTAFFFFEDDGLVNERVYFDSATILRQLGIAHDPLSLRGRLATVVNHPVTVGGAVVRSAQRRL